MYGLAFCRAYQPQSGASEAMTFQDTIHINTLPKAQISPAPNPSYPKHYRAHPERLQQSLPFSLQSSFQGLRRIRLKYYIPSQEL
jgi:hypothetical protein